MKMLSVSITVLLFATNSFAQDTLLKSSYSPGLKSSYNIGKSKDPDVYPADSIPLFVIKGGGKSKKISPAKILELAPKGNNLMNVIPSKFLKAIFIFKGSSVPRRYRKQGVYQVVEISLLKDKVNEAFKFLTDYDYLQ